MAHADKIPQVPKIMNVFLSLLNTKEKEGENFLAFLIRG